MAPRTTLLLLLAACAEEVAPPDPMIPHRFEVDASVRRGPTGDPALAPDGGRLVGQAVLRLGVMGEWAVPSPVPGTGCTATWTWDEAPSPVAPRAGGTVVEAWLAEIGATTGYLLDPRAADAVRSTCVWIDEVPVEGLLPGGVVLALHPSSYLPFPEAERLAGALSPYDTATWPWLAPSHVAGATLAIVGAEGGPAASARPGVAVGLALDAGRRLQPGAYVFETAAADAVLDGSADVLLRVKPLVGWALPWAPEEGVTASP